MGVEPRGKNFEITTAKDCRVVLGDEHSASFKPHVRVTRWGDEGSFAFGLPTVRNVTPSFDGEKIVWSDEAVSGLEMRFFGLDAKEQLERGGLEWEIVLTRPPVLPSVTLSLEMQGLSALYQPALTPWQVSSGRFRRPANVVGSYAFYHRTKGTMHSVPGDAEKYLTGKAFHLYRPEAIDALGARAWGSLLVDERAGTVIIGFDPVWLAAATYPVVIDPSIGYTSLGASEDTPGGNQIAVSGTSAAAGAANPGTAFIGVTNAGTASAVGAYAGGADPANRARLAVSSVFGAYAGAAAFRSAAITWTGILASTQYWIIEGNHSSSPTLMFDSAGGSAWYNDPQTLIDPSEEFGWNDLTPAVYSVYVDYAAAAVASDEGYEAVLRARLPESIVSVW